MSSSLNVIALISGGKDSFYSILHLLRHGHKLVAIANLHPPDQDNVDTDSMMYQTIGHNVINTYIDALGEGYNTVYRWPLGGEAICKDQVYQLTRGDETEKIRELLCLIMNNHPEANAVSTGAIMSDYQRTRVEFVAARLKLVSLAYLWQYPILPPPPERRDSVSGLLDDMAAIGCDSRIIKTAHGNFNESLIGLNVADPRTISRITNLARRWVANNELELRASILGEGGEYETITVDGPWPLWKYRIPVKPGDFKIVKRDGPTLYAGLAEPTVELKSVPVDGDQPSLRVPSTFDPQFLEVDFLVRRDSIEDVEKLMGNVSLQSVQPTRYFPVKTLPSLERRSEHHIAMSNLQCRVDLKEFETRMNTLFDRCSGLCQREEEDKLGVRDVTFVMLQLASMRDFADVNKWYQEYFRFVNPPARVTLATRLPYGARFSISLLIDLRDRKTRRALHVQSRSYWAPANIGPYSQAIAEPLNTPHGKTPSMTFDGEPELVHMAGQIPLVPHSMEIFSRPFLEQAILSLQHLWRVGQERGVDLWTHGVAFLPSHPESPFRARVAIDVWQKAHLSPTWPKEKSEEQEEIDPWDAQQNFQFSSQHTDLMLGRGHHLHKLPNFDVFVSDRLRQTAPPCIVAEVLALPREAPIEWWSTGLANLPKKICGTRTAAASGLDEDVDLNILGVRSLFFEGREDGEGTMDNDGANFLTLSLRSNGDGDAETLRRILNQFLQGCYEDGNPQRRIVSGTCFVTDDKGQEVYEKVVRDEWMTALSVVSCRRLFVDDTRRNRADSHIRAADFVVVLRSEEVEPKHLEKAHGRQT